MKGRNPFLPVTKTNGLLTAGLRQPTQMSSISAWGQTGHAIEHTGGDRKSRQHADLIQTDPQGRGRARRDRKADAFARAPAPVEARNVTCPIFRLGRISRLP